MQIVDLENKKDLHKLDLDCYQYYNGFTLSTMKVYSICFDNILKSIYQCTITEQKKRYDTNQINFRH